MYDDDPNTPLDFPVSDTEYYPEDVEISTRHKKSARVWAPETLEIMESFGYHPEDMDNGSEDEEEDSDQEADEELEESKFDHLSSYFVPTQLVSEQPVGETSQGNTSPANSEVSFEGWCGWSAS